jgi:hypothetical protein
MIKWPGPTLAGTILSLIAAPACRTLDAQAPERVAAVAAAGSDIERELRALQLTGRIPQRIWSIRAFNATEIATMLAGVVDSLPARLTSESHRLGGVAWQILAPEAGTIVNTSFPYGFNDGPLWAGRGVTGFASGGISARAGAFSARLHPTVFLAQNASFEPAIEGSFMLNTPYAKHIDLPERFGDRRYGRFDSGESEVRLQTQRIAAGISSASQVWGPAVEHPLILGNNAGGFPHAFIETARPLNLHAASFHTRLIWGRLDGSAFGPSAIDDRRFVSAAIVAVSFPALSGFELGAARFFHSPWPSDGIIHAPFFNVFQGILKSTVSTQSNPTGDVPGDNQLASVFFRWAFPTSGVEVYGEYGREDHNANIQDFWMEIDHDAGFLLGIQRAWRSGDRNNVVRIEHLNTRMGKLHPTRAQAPWYVHGVRVQGHTLRGQLLAAPGGFGGGGTTMAWDRLGMQGRTTVRWDRAMRAEQINNNELIPEASQADVTHALGIERSRRLAAGEVMVGITGVLELNRDFRSDVFNLNTSIRYRLTR